MTENEIATTIVHTAFHIHRDLGPGLFESVYERILEVELTKRALTVARQSQYRLSIMACTSKPGSGVTSWLKTK